jgi:hypothetical protein
MFKSLREFRNEYLELMLDFMWRQWSQIGVFGEAYNQDNWVIDPEALLLISLEMGRYEPRMFDEVVDWLVINGKWLNVQRLNNIIKLDDQYNRDILFAVADILSKEDKSAKWRRVSKNLAVKSPINNREELHQSFFLFKDGKPMPVMGKVDETFRKYGFLRTPVNLRKLSKEIQSHSPSNLWLKLRALFGVNLRADIIAYLITHESAHPRRVAREVIFSQPRVQTTMAELPFSGLVWIKHTKREKHYWLNREYWWQAINITPGGDIPKWINWVSLFRGFLHIWRRLSEPDIDSLSQYLQLSELRQLMEVVRNDLEQSGLKISHPLPTEPYKFEDYVGSVFESLREILGSPNV